MTQPDKAALGDWPPPFELMKLQARSKGGEWTDIYPAQLEDMAKNGCCVRAIDPPSTFRASGDGMWEAQAALKASRLVLIERGLSLDSRIIRVIDAALAAAPQAQENTP